jgi:hypothetical protein
MMLIQVMAVHRHHHPSDEFRRLQTEAAQTRVRSIQSQIAIGLTFCSVAECQLKLGHAEHLDAVIAKLRKLTATARRHLNEPGHVPSSDVEKICTELARLESGILALEERKRSNCC